MAQPLNPYESPRSPSRPLPNWLAWLRSWFRPLTDSDRFLRGDRVFRYGVLLELAPDDDTQFIASLPLAVDDELHTLRNVAEARRVLVVFLSIHPELAPVLAERTLVVAMISSFSRIDDVIQRVYVPASEWRSDRARALAADNPYGFAADGSES